jgi:HTH-type transcriptional regulator/antitoxin HigA
MKPKIIKTESDHTAALARIEAIFDARPGTPEGDELELLTLLVDRYEREAFPIDLPDAISAIRFRMEQQGLKNKDLVPFIGSPSKVSEVLSGQRGLSLSMIRNLAGGLGIPVQVLVGLPGARLRPREEVDELQKYPIAQMLKRGWFSGFQGTVAEARSQLEDLFIRFAGEVEGRMPRPAFNRQHVRSGSQPDPYALAAWRLRVINLATKDRLPAYGRGTVNSQFLSELVQLSYLEAGPRLATEFLNKNGIHLVVERHLPGTHLDGAAMQLPDDSPLVALTLRHDRLDNFWFTLFHELAHIALHMDQSQIDAFYDDLEGTGRDKLEQEADEFAEEALIPSRHWKASGLARRAPAQAVVQFANQLRISPAIPAGRVRYERGNFAILKELVGQGKVRCLFSVSRS